MGPTMQGWLTLWGPRALLVVGAGTALLAFRHLLRYLSGRAKVASIATGVVGAADLRPGEVVARLQESIGARLEPWPPGEFEKRPFLRDAAESLWTMRLGKCGDGTRLMIQLLGRRGIPARRVVLYDAAGVAINAGFEYLDDGKWIYEGAFNSPSHETEYTRRHPASLREHLGGANPIVEHYASFSYVNVRRLGIDFLLTRPLPRWMGILLETPSLVRTVGWSLAGLVCVGLRWVVMPV
jgi:hypothetical protein